MPSERFYRLSEEKQSLIWKASMKEFASEPYEKVSINKIIRNAGISRGSFYTYFEDKRDLLSFLLGDTERQWRESCLACLEKKDGDVFAALEAMMEYGMEFCKNNDLFRLHKNLIIYPEAMISECMCGDIKLKQTAGREFLTKVDRSCLRDKTDEGILLLMKQGIISMMAGFVEYYNNPEREEMIRAEYKKALSVLRYGACVASEKDQVEG